MVNEAGEKVFLEGVGLGNWLLPEGYMWKFGEYGDRPRKIEKVVSDLIGEEHAEEFWNEFRRNYITEADIREIARLGFNSVRPALNSRIFLKESDGIEFIEDGFLLIDSLISWCSKYNLYVIIDMHGAPGGQTGANIDDSPNDEPELFMNEKYQDQLVALWVRIAERYKDEPVVAAYDLLNEPLPEVTGAAEKYKHLLVPLYRRLIAEIRTVDDRHMISIEGFNWSNNWSLFDKPLDDNAFYQFHYYCWDRPDNLNNIDYYLKKRGELNTPVWVGETGEQGKTIYWATGQYFRTNNVGYSFWPWKKMDTQNTPYSIVKPEYWDLVAEYTKGGVRPDSAVASKAFAQLLENIKFENCIFFQDVVNVFFNRVPAKIQAENYGHDGYNVSYFVQDTAQRAQTYRVRESVLIKVLDEEVDGRSTHQYVELKESEWLVYKFRNQEEGLFKISWRTATDVLTEVTFLLNDVPINLKVQNKEWATLDVGEFELKEGDHQIKLNVQSGTLKLDWINIE
jgi:hypothetical protein